MTTPGPCFCNWDFQVCYSGDLRTAVMPWLYLCILCLELYCKWITEKIQSPQKDRQQLPFLCWSKEPLATCPQRLELGQIHLFSAGSIRVVHWEHLYASLYILDWMEESFERTEVVQWYDITELVPWFREEWYLDQTCKKQEQSAFIQWFKCVDKLTGPPSWEMLLEPPIVWLPIFSCILNVRGVCVCVCMHTCMYMHIHVYFPFIWKVCCCGGDGGNTQIAQNGTR